MTIEQWLAVFAAGHRDARGVCKEPCARAEDALDVCGVVMLVVLGVFLVLRSVA